MGFFSWKTSNSNRSIANKYSRRSTFTVLMISDKGTVYEESDYEGYGVFGKKDFFQLVAEMNECPGLTGNVDNDRQIGIDLFYDNNSGGDSVIALKNGVKTPVLVEKSQIREDLLDNPIEIYMTSKPSEQCEYQGFFYD